MPRDGSKTRTILLDAALELALENGLGSTSIDEILEKAKLTKGTFFYHFKNKDELALELVKRFVEQDHALFVDTVARVESLSRDPLQQVLLVCGLAAEMFKDGPDNPGCLMASYCYEGQLFNEESRKACEAQLREWADWVEKKLKEAAKTRKPAPANLRQVAEMFQVIFEGAFILARTYKEPDIIAKQVLAYRDMVEALFAAGAKPRG
ncbi:MAG: TetR/AcrR family transcriptional regulator [Planctomycetes bacterium]|nr:TetR/AcrR family transcriptional regulator [Planctomycetota bacterium]